MYPSIPLLTTIGWREWVSLPELKIPALKAKIDTGAKTSSLHAFNITPVQRNNMEFVTFDIHPVQKNNHFILTCEAPVIDKRIVKDSGGHEELRYVIKTALTLGTDNMTIEMTLSNRDNMRFKMLLGRHALKNKYCVNPAQSYLCGKLDANSLYPLHSIQSTP